MMGWTDVVVENVVGVSFLFLDITDVRVYISINPLFVIYIIYAYIFLPQFEVSE